MHRKINNKLKKIFLSYSIVKIFNKLTTTEEETRNQTAITFAEFKL